MRATVQQIQSAVLGNPVTSPDPFFNRLSSVLPSAGQNPAQGVADLAALLRQAVLRAEESTEEPPDLTVPLAAGWPDAAFWQRFSFEVMPSGPGYLRIRPKPWGPAWLDAGAGDAVMAAIREEKRRCLRPVPADPSVIQHFGWPTYASAGQRAAVQAAFLTPAGSTTIVCLPTGGGKSAAFQLPALAWQEEGGLTLVIVPTVALARDQESRFRALLGDRAGPSGGRDIPLAYHGGLEESAKRAMREGIQNGEVPIVFTSPESALQSLRNVLFVAARQGRLKLFVVDEAHLVAQWGEEFRPEFQSLTGLRDALLEGCPPQARFRTLLLSATLTAETCETLRFLFGRNQCELVAEIALRPEISFLSYPADDESARIQRVLEAVDHMPRPLILYTTLRDDAALWYERFVDRGYRRLRLVRGGDLSDENGGQILQDWRDGEVDVVVATSAFGVGMDQSNVRSVIHACLPETIDRYYQEVGRAGRDGNAAVALLASEPGDVEVAHTLAEKRRISVERGFERWDSMWWHRFKSSDDTFVVPLDVSPPDITAPGERNESWNLRTLVLMARAGLIEFGAHPPPRVDPRAKETAKELEQRRQQDFERFRKQVAVRVLDDRSLQESHWSSRVAEVRAILRNQDQNASRLVDELRSLNRPLNDLFRQVYQLSSPPACAPRLAGSCPVTRARGTVSFRAAEAEVISFSTTDVKTSDLLAKHLLACTDSAGRSWIAYTPALGEGLEARQWRKSMISMLRFMVSQGVLELAIPDGLCEASDWRQLNADSSRRFVIRGDFAQEDLSGLFARLTFLDRSHLNTATLDRMMRLSRPRHVIVLPGDTPDPERPGRALLDRVNHIFLEDLWMRVAR